MPLIEGYLCEKRGLPMSLKSVCFGLAVLVSASSVSMAQSLPNYGANPPRNVDSFGQPPSGAKPPGVSRYGHRAYAYVPNQHRRHSRYWHHRHWYWWKRGTRRASWVPGPAPVDGTLSIGTIEPPATPSRLVVGLARTSGCRPHDPRQPFSLRSWSECQPGTLTSPLSFS